MEGNSSRRQKGNIVTISRKTPRSAEWKRLQHGRGTGKGLEDCRKASIGVRGSAESRGRDSSGMKDLHCKAISAFRCQESSLSSVNK